MGCCFGTLKKEPVMVSSANTSVTEMFGWIRKRYLIKVYAAEKEYIVELKGRIPIMIKQKIADGALQSEIDEIHKVLDSEIAFSAPRLANASQRILDENPDEDINTLDLEVAAEVAKEIKSEIKKRKKWI